jgi:hypothetical protein
MEISEEIVTTPNCPCKNDENCNCMNKKMQKHDNMMKHEKKMKKKMAEIDEHYNKAIKKTAIKRSFLFFQVAWT